MQLLHSLSAAKPTSPTALTIGMFDGMHLGHTMLLNALKEAASSSGIKQTLITFSNHPSSVLRPSQITPLLCTVEHKIHLLEKAGLDTVILLPFTREFSEQTAEEFLKRVSSHFLIHSLILGRDATLGKNRAGGPEAVKTVTETLNFPVTYLEDFTVNNERVSSSRIRNLILEGKLTEAGVLLGRRYSIYAPVIQGEGKGKALGFPTANISVKELCLPPCGVYAATCRYQNRDYRAIANLGVAPTLKDMTTPLLEVHILDQTLNLYGESVEIFLDHYIRPEQRFTGVDSLKQQIAHDIATCRKLPIKLG